MRFENSSNWVSSPSSLKELKGPPTIPNVRAHISYMLTKANLKKDKGEM